MQALDEHGYEWTENFNSSVPKNLSLLDQEIDSTFDCDSNLTRIIVGKSEIEFNQKICLFESKSKIANELDCGEDGLHVLMCRDPFLHLEKVSTVIKFGHCKKAIKFENNVPLVLKFTQYRKNKFLLAFQKT